MGKRTQYQLEKEIEDRGGHLNAYTSREQTVYYAKVLKEDVEQATDILSDILQNSLLDKGAIERERAVILREMEEVMSMREEVVFDELHATAYQGTSLGRTILGPEENIRSITQEDLRKYTDTHYTAPRMVFAGAGAIEHEQMVDLASKTFDKLPAGNSSSEVSTELAQHKFTGADARFIDQSMKDVHFAMAFETVGWTHPDSVVFMVMQSLQGIGARRRLQVCDGIQHDLQQHGSFRYLRHRRSPHSRELPIHPDERAREHVPQAVRIRNRARKEPTQDHSGHAARRWHLCCLRRHWSSSPDIRTSAAS